jgi:hypothetical protein
MRNQLVQPQWLAAIALFTLSIAAHGHEPPSGLLAHLPLDGSLADASGNEFDGIGLAGDGERRAPSYVEGKFGRGVQLDGDTAVLIPLDVYFERYPEVTITGWVFVESDDARGALIGTGGGDGPEIRVNGDTLFALRPGGGRNTAHGALRPGRWTFFAGVWNYRNGTMRLAWGSRSSTENFSTDDLDAPGQDVVIGAKNHRMNLAGNSTRLDDIRVYGRSLERAELARLRNDESGDVRLAGAGDEPRERSSETMPGIAQGEAPPGATLDRDDFGASEELVTELETAGEQPAATDKEAPGTIGPNAAPGTIGPNAAPGTIGPNAEPDHVVVIDGSGGPGRTRYNLSASGPIEKAEGRLHGVDVTINDNDVIDGQTATGVVGSAADGYYLYGDITEISLDDRSAASVYVDGELLRHGLIIDGAAKPGRTRYTVRTSGRLLPIDGKVDGVPVTINEDDTVSGNRSAARGYVGNARDGYLVFGEIENISLQNPDAAVIYVDRYALRHRVVLKGTGSGRTRYTLETNGPIGKVRGEIDGFQATVNQNDAVSVGIAEGVVGDGTDAYYVYGAIEAVTLIEPSAADLYIDGELFDAGGGEPRTIRQPLEPDSEFESVDATGSVLPPGELEVTPSSEGELYLPVVSGTMQRSAITGTTSTDKISIDLEDATLHTITWLEESDRPCDFRISGYAEGVNRFGSARNSSDSVEVCNGDAGNAGSSKTVSLREQKGVIQRLGSCGPQQYFGTAPRSVRIKGLLISGSLLEGNRSLSSIDRHTVEEKRTNCRDENDTVACFRGGVATGVVLHVYRQDNGNYFVSGLQLICREAAGQ